MYVGLGIFGQEFIRNVTPANSKGNLYCPFNFDFFYLLKRIGLFWKLSSNIQPSMSFYMRFCNMPVNFYAPYLPHIMRETCTSLKLFNEPLNKKHCRENLNVKELKPLYVITANIINQTPATRPILCKKLRHVAQTRIYDMSYIVCLQNTAHYEMSYVVGLLLCVWVVVSSILSYIIILLEMFGNFGVFPRELSMGSIFGGAIGHASLPPFALINQKF